MWISFNNNTSTWNVVDKYLNRLDLCKYFIFARSQKFLLSSANFHFFKVYVRFIKNLHSNRSLGISFFSPLVSQIERIIEPFSDSRKRNALKQVLTISIDCSLMRVHNNSTNSCTRKSRNLAVSDFFFFIHWSVLKDCSISVG